jgi:hypothetical protein
MAYVTENDRAPQQFFAFSKLPPYRPSALKLLKYQRRYGHSCDRVRASVQIGRGAHVRPAAGR